MDSANNHSIEASPKRNDAFDIMKCVGILAIMLGHFSSSINGLLFSFHVPLFFFLAGLFFKEIPLSASIKKDTTRLLLPYFCTCLIIILFFAFRQLYNNEGFSSRWLIASVWGSGSHFHTSKYFSEIPPIGAIWFLLSLFWCKQTFLIIKKIIPGLYPLVCLMLSIGGTIIDRVLINLPFAILPGLSALVFFCAGEMIQSRKSSCHSKAIEHITIIICCLAWIAVLFLSHLNDIRLSLARCYYKFYPLDVIAAFGGIWIVFRLSTLIQKLPAPFKRILIWIGRNSLVFLCLHLIDLNIGIRHYFQVGNGIAGFSFNLMFCILGTIVLSFIPPVKQALKIYSF